MSETALVNAIIAYLTYRGALAIRINAGGIVTGEEKRRYVRLAPVGCPDVIACISGRWVGIEAKIGRNKQTPAQLDFQRRVNEAGGVYIVCRDVDELSVLFQEVK
jgi:hypothetical protein